MLPLPEEEPLRVEEEPLLRVVALLRVVELPLREVVALLLRVVVVLLCVPAELPPERLMVRAPVEAELLRVVALPLPEALRRATAERPEERVALPLPAALEFVVTRPAWEADVVLRAWVGVALVALLPRVPTPSVERRVPK